MKESLLSSTDSDLQEFGHNPTDASFVPCACQATANCQLSLSAVPLGRTAELLLQQHFSRVKRMSIELNTVFFPLLLLPKPLPLAVVSLDSR